MEDKEKDNWLPLESNPEVITNFIADLGFDTNKYILHDLLSIEEWAQEMLPQPTVGVLFLFPVSTAQEEFAEEEDEQIEKNGQIVSPNVNIYYDY